MKDFLLERLKLLFGSIAVLALAVSAPASFGGGDGIDVVDPKPAAAMSVSNDATKAIVNAISEGRAYCDKVTDGEYIIDCLSERLTKLRKDIPRTGDYADARAIIDDAAKKLNAIAKANRSSEEKRKRLNVDGTSTSRAIVPVDKTKINSAVAQAEAVIREAETKLLRSGSSAQGRKVHYQRIASAIGSNKVLLRSAARRV